MSKIFGVYFRNLPDQDGKFFDIAVEKDDYDTMYCLAAEFLHALAYNRRINLVVVFHGHHLN